MERLPAHVLTPRLTLRTWSAEDEPAMSAAITRSIDHLRPWMPWIANEPVPAADRIALLAKWQEDWEAGGDVVLGIFETATGAVVGGTGLHKRQGPGSLEIGYWVHVDHVGRGFATETSRALTEVAFGVPGIDRVEIHHDKANLASGRVPQKLGYDFVGELPRDITAPGECGITWTWRRIRGVERLSRTS